MKARLLALMVSGAILMPTLRAAITDHLVAHLRFDQTLEDSSGRTNHGAAVGNVTFGAGKVGSGAANLSFRKDGSGFNFVTLGAPADLNFGTTTDFTVSFWSKFTNFVFDPPFIGNKDWLSGQYQGWMVATGTDGRLQWNYGGAPGQRKDYDGPGRTMDDGRWHHVLITFLRAGEVTTYLDGVVVDQRDVSASLNNVDTPAGQAVNIGQDGTGRYTDGGSVEILDLMMDDVGIWRRVLTAAEAVAVYQAGEAGRDLSTVVSTPEVPSFARSPNGASVVAGENVTLSVLPRGTSPFTFEWRRGTSAIPGATNAILSLTNVQSADAGSYICVVSNVAGSATSEPAEVSVDLAQPPAILAGPLGVTAAPNARVELRVSAAGVAPLSYTWFRNGDRVPGATSSTLVIPRMRLADEGRYTVEVRAGNGQTSTSLEAVVGLVSDIRQGLVAHLTFDEDFRDSSGRGNHGSPVGNPTLVDGFVGGKALRFSHRSDGTEFNFVTLGQAADLEFSVDADFSFSMWVKFSRWQRDPLFISNKNWSSGGNVGYALATGADGRFQWNYAEQVGERRDYDSAGGLVSDGRWHHVAVTFQRGGEAVTFVDGIEVNRQPLPTTGTTISPGLPTNIGQDGTGTYTDNRTVSMEDGTIDDVAIWRRSITPEEIQQIRNKGLAGANVQERGLNQDLVVWLPFDGDASDRSGRGNHGVRIGNPRYVPGHTGGALAVSSVANGSSFNYVTLGSPADLQFGRTTAFSVSFWTRFTNWTGDPVLVGNKDWRSGGNQGWVVATAGNGRLQWNLGDGDAGGRSRRDYDGPAGTLSDGNWHHVATVFDRSGNALTFLDGNVVSTNVISGDLDSIDTPQGLAVNIGQDGVGAYTDNGAVGIRNALLDDVAIWRRALDPAEVRVIFTRGQGGADLFGRVPGPSTMPNGVASGEVTQDSVLLWARSTATGVLRFAVSTNRAMEPLVATAMATNLVPEVPAKVTVAGLQPGTRYHYRVTDAAGTASFGTFRTASAPDTFGGLRFGVSGDSRGDLAPFPSVANIPARALDFYVNLGDTIYADVPSPAVTSPSATTLEQFRRKHDEVLGSRLGVPSIPDLRASTAVFATIDDHEVVNDFAGGARVGSDSRFDTNGTYLNETQLFRSGLQAFVEYNPMATRTYDAPSDARVHGRTKLYRTARFGRDAAMFLLDSRSFRDQGLPGVANPTDPVQIGAFLAQSFDVNPLNGQPLPRRTMLGRPQIEELKADLVAAELAGVEWKFVLVPEPIQNLGVLAASDRFEGYAAERSELLGFVHDRRIRNVVFISADIHGTLVNNLSYQAAGPLSPKTPVSAWEVVTGAIAYDAPFGPTVLDLASEVPSGSGSLLDQFLGSLGLPNRAAFDQLLTPAQKNDAIAGLVNSQVQPLGYSPVGLQDSRIDARFDIGGPAAVFTYGWTEFNIDATTRALQVTTYGLPSYTQAQINEDLLLTQPVAVSRFTVQPERPILSVRRVAGRVRVAWARSITGFRLERSVSLGDGSDWQPVNSVVEGDENVAEVGETTVSFYRLRQL
jgi:alkaline phosphatase D